MSESLRLLIVILPLHWDVSTRNASPLTICTSLPAITFQFSTLNCFVKLPIVIVTRTYLPLQNWQAIGVLRGVLGDWLSSSESDWLLWPEVAVFNHA